MVQIWPILPIIVALVLFRYLRNTQARRNDTMRQRFWKMEEQLLQILTSKKE
jgi:hypothetical protein